MMHGKIKQRRAWVLRRAKRFRRYLFTGSLGAMILAGGVYGVAQTPIFDVREVALSGGSVGVRALVDAQVKTLIGKNIFSVSSKEVASALMRSPLLSEVSVKKHLPSSLEIHVGVRVPVATLRVSNSHLAEVSSDGTVFTQVPISATSSSPLPELCVLGSSGFGNCSLYQDPLSIGDKVQPYLLAAISVAREMTSSELNAYRYVGVSISGDLYLSDGGDFVCKLGSASDASAKLRICDAMKLTFGSKGGPSYVDVTSPSNPTAEPTSWIS
ncbi:Cell division septal protein FtsQ [Ferrithrix thermotolerans DSM 19514]|uniref:Cell division septal protein FtsQ n=1 Tax=Ferrithrix thermotolerans DSM 19514 TaxID=1121881 RepID=A0A1M4TSM6_9ACTN|nr:FtsQ-type POTRA domain-containing protein [Ferrithrix thermotolerans]SHE47418.1 Cell division septal protein FtsQ [Ferrithrix thermotolerans DSM 19514]